MDEASLFEFLGAEFGYVTDGCAIRLSVELLRAQLRAPKIGQHATMPT
jgi:hypothetical protein